MVTNFCCAVATDGSANARLSATAAPSDIRRLLFMIPSSSEMPKKNGEPRAALLGDRAPCFASRCKRGVDRDSQPVDDLVELIIGDDERGREQHVIAAPAVDRATHRI